MQWISAIIALLKAIPIFDNWFRELLMAYTNNKFDKEFTRAWLKLIAEKDQRLMEEVLRMKAGPPDNMDGVVARPNLPKED